MDAVTEQSSPGGVRENRTYERTKLYLPGQIFDPASAQSMACKVLNLSAGGAAVQCEQAFAPNVPLVLHVENFGRFEGHTVIHADGQLALKFSIGENKRGRLTEMLKAFALHGATGVTELRRHARMPALVSGRMVRANGQVLICDVLDISLDGVSVRTEARPPLGEIVNLGRSHGRVVRHHADGFAVQYVREAEKAA